MAEISAWLKWRHDGIGASDAPVVMNVSPWKTPFQLYVEKTSEVAENNSNFIQERGNRLEPMIRRRAELHFNNDFKAQTFQHKDWSWMRCSMDGVTEDLQLGVEIKYVGLEDFEGAQKGICPEKYYPQVQHQYAVSGVKNIYLVCYYIPPGKKETEGFTHYLHVPLDMVYIEKMARMEIDFWECVQTKTPPQLTDRDIPVVKDKDLLTTARAYARLDKKIEDLEAQKEEMKEKLLNIQGGSFVIGPLKILEVERIGNVDYKKVPQLHGVDLNQYRGKSTVSRHVKVMK